MRAFTLTELIIVFAILAILISGVSFLFNSFFKKGSDGERKILIQTAPVIAERVFAEEGSYKDVCVDEEIEVLISSLAPSSRTPCNSLGSHCGCRSSFDSNTNRSYWVIWFGISEKNNQQIVCVGQGTEAAIYGRVGGQNSILFSRTTPKCSDLCQGPSCTIPVPLR